MSVNFLVQLLTVAVSSRSTSEIFLFWRGNTQDMEASFLRLKEVGRYRH